ncbi:MAG: hypothetical protein GTO40_17315 [Deltaproteobacteria bacterium]|nr:hypothetical protein [Deltaproteobacteria bacterium]
MNHGRILATQEEKKQYKLVIRPDPQKLHPIGFASFSIVIGISGGVKGNTVTVQFPVPLLIIKGGII